MRPLRLVLVLALVLFPTTPVWAILGVGDVVIDPTNLVQNTLTAARTLVATVNQGRQIANEVTMIAHQVQQLANQVTNLQRMPAGLNVLDAMATYGSQLEGLMAQATTVGFALNQVTTQFDGLYRAIGTVVTTGDILALRDKMLGARLEASSMAVQMQAVRTNITDVYTRIGTLLSGVSGAAGNLDSQQLAAQQQALMTHTLQTMQAMQATNARVMVQREAEDVVMHQLRLKAQQHLNVRLPRYTGDQGTLVTYTW